MKKFFALFMIVCAAFGGIVERSAAAASATVASVREVSACAWSYFGDPRAVAKAGFIFTGCISTSRWVTVERYDYVSGAHKKFKLRRNAEMDDHDNPSLVFFKGRLCAFASPHSGHRYPLNRQFGMRYWCSRRKNGLGGFGRARLIPLPKECGLGYTYPNPVLVNDRLFLFMRGPCWYPYYTSTVDGKHWSIPRTLVLGPKHNRPYAKYVGGSDGSVHMVFSDGHPQAYRNSLYYARMKNGRMYKANGKLIGSLREAPFRLSQLDRIYKFTEQGGRAWPHDIAVRNQKPVVVYTRRLGGPGGIDHFYYAAWKNGRWINSPIVSAGVGTRTFHSGGASFNHANPDWIVLSRRPTDADVEAGLYKQTRWNQVELWHSADIGITWSRTLSVTGGAATSSVDDESAYNIRPVIPRSFNDPTRLVVIYSHGTSSSFREFFSVIRLRIEESTP